MARPGHAERARHAQRARTVEVAEPSALGRLTQYATALVLCDLRCAMLAFVRDPFMTSHAGHGPVPVDLLGMRNGLAMHPL